MVEQRSREPPALTPDRRFRDTRFGAAATAGNVDVSSRGQSGGITAGQVHIYGDANLGAPPSPPQPPSKSPWWKSWWAILSGAAVILAGVVPTLDYLHIEWPQHHAPATQVQQLPVPAQKPAEAPQQPAVQSAVPAEQPALVDAHASTPHAKPQRKQHPATMKQPPDPQSPPQGTLAAQPAEQPQVNVSSQNQSGGITAGTVNIYGQKQQRHLDQQGAGFLTQHIPKSAKVTVTAVMGDGEAFTYAKEITDWMRGNGWTNVDGISQAIFSGPVFGQGVNPKPDGSFDIQIGNQH